MKSFQPLDKLVDADRSIAYGIVQPGGYYPNGVPVIRVNNFINGKIDMSDILLVDPVVEQKYLRTRLHGNELLLTLVGSVGQTALTDESMKGCNVARAVAVIPIRKDINIKWVKYYIDSPIVQQYFKEELNTTVQATLNLKSVKSTSIWLPDSSYIDKVVNILSSIDEKISCNECYIKDISSIIQIIYQNWFSDFNYPNATGEKQNDIPVGWTNSNVFDNVTEIREKNKDNHNYPVLSVVKEGEFRPSDDVFKKQVYSKETTNYKIVRRNQVAYNPARANIGSIAMLTDFDIGLVSPVYVVFEMKETITPSFFYYYMKQPMFAEGIKHHAIGTTRQNFPFDAFKMFPMIVPPMELQKRFDEIAKPIEQKIAKLKEENAVLAEIRDTLLPKLMSGELSVEMGDV